MFFEQSPRVQVNLCQKLLFLYRLIHNMMTVLKLKNYRPRVSKKTKTNSPQLDQGIALQQGTPHKELRKELPIQNQ